MEHLLHLTAKHFVESIAPGFSVTDPEHVITEGNDSNDDDNINAADSLGRAIALIKQICKSSQARSFFCTSSFSLWTPVMMCHASQSIKAMLTTIWTLGMCSG
jgi:hypothetical protein